MSVRPTAIIDPRAKIPGSCKIGPYCVIGPDVELGEKCHLVSHVIIEGPTKIGADLVKWALMTPGPGGLPPQPGMTANAAPGAPPCS